jgi:hypothetical protein
LSKERRALLPLHLPRSLLAALALVSVLASAALLHEATPAGARIFNVNVVDPALPGFNDGDFDLIDAQIFFLTPSDGIVGNSGFSLDTYFATVDSVVWFGISAEEGAGSITADSGGYGTFIKALCNDNNNNGQDFEDPADTCVNMSGVSTQHLIIPDAGNSLDHQPTPPGQARFGIALAFRCQSNSGIAHITIGQGVSTFDFFMVCHGLLARGTIAATATQLEILPQIGSTAHSLLRLDLFDAAGGIVAGYEVDWSVDRCAIESSDVDSVDEVLSALAGQLNVPRSAAPDTESPQLDTARNLVFDFNGDGLLESLSMAIVHCEPGHSPTTTPGPIHVTARASRPGAPTLTFSFLLNLIGPPAKIIVSATPTSLRCGEKSTVTAVVVDSINQTVSDNTPIEFVVNYGGTGVVGRILGPVAPLASGVGVTTNGVAPFFVLTSDQNVGTYEIVATAEGFPNQPPVTASTQISCFVPATPAAAAPAATAVAPAGAQTSTAAVRPPNTGDGGLR